MGATVAGYLAAVGKLAPTDPRVVLSELARSVAARIDASSTPPTGLVHELASLVARIADPPPEVPDPEAPKERDSIDVLRDRLRQRNQASAPESHSPLPPPG